MTEIESEQNNNQNISQNYINLLNNLILSLKSNPINSLNNLSNIEFLYSLIIEIEPNFSKISLDENNNNFISLLALIEKYSNESKSKDKFTKETKFSETISIKELLNNDLNELIKIAEMLIFLTIICSNKNYYIEKINEIDDNNISKLYYSIIEKYIFFKIDESVIINKENESFDKYLNNNQIISVKTIKINKDYLNFGDVNNNIEFDTLMKDIENINKNDENNELKKYFDKIKIDNLTKEIIKLKAKLEKCEEEKKIIEHNLNESKILNKTNSKDFQGELIIQKQESFFNQRKSITSENEIIKKLQNENEELQKLAQNLLTEKKELIGIIDKSNIKIKEIEFDYQKLKEEYDLKELNSSHIISNNKEIIEKLNSDLRLEIKVNQKLNQEKEDLENEINKYKEELSKYDETIKNDEKENNELLLIKKNLEDKDKEIKKLKDKNIIYEKEKEDINFYKKSYEEQKLRVNEEHKLISDSLYKLAIHFISLKDDLQNRINSAKKNK